MLFALILLLPTGPDASDSYVLDYGLTAPDCLARMAESAAMAESLGATLQCEGAAPY